MAKSLASHTLAETRCDFFPILSPASFFEDRLKKLPFLVDGALPLPPDCWEDVSLGSPVKCLLKLLDEGPPLPTRPRAELRFDVPSLRRSAEVDSGHCSITSEHVDISSMSGGYMFSNCLRD